MKATRVLRDSDYDKVTLTKEWNNGDFNLRLAIKITYLEEYLSESDLKTTGKYDVEVLAISPEACGEENLNKAIESQGMDVEDYKDIPLFDYESLIDYGIFATLWNAQGNNLRNLVTEANKQLSMIQMLFGFYMDRAENRIGNDGWDFISGNIGFRS